MTKAKRKKLLIGVVSLIAVIGLVIGAVWLFRQSDEEYLRAQYPLEYRDFVIHYATVYGLDESLVYAVIHTESHFDPQAVSSAGAVGLMQMTPDTFQWAQWREKIDPPFDNDRLTDPETNIRFGCATLHHLGKLFSDEKTVLAAYNAGMGNVGKWLNDPAYSDDGETLHTIPFPETEQYIKKVYAAQEMYESLYGPES